MSKKILIYLILFFLPLVFASDVSVNLVTSGNDTWSCASTVETFNFTITNGNSDFSFNVVNITVPDGFSFSGGLDGSLINWVCQNNSTTVSCYNETDFLTQGESINIWFNSISISSSDEENVTWKVLLVNETTGNNNVIEVSSGIDGKPPQVNGLTMNYMSEDFENGDNVTQREPITVTVQAEDNGVGIDKVWVDVYNSSNDLVQNVVLPESILTSSLDEGDYIVNISVNDSFGNLNHSVESFSFTIIPLPDLEVGEFTLNPVNPYPGQNLTVYVNITKDGNCDGSIDMTWSLDNNSFYVETINCLDIVGVKKINCTFASFSGEKNISLMVDSGDDVSEYLENNNYQSQMVSTNLNVTVLDVDPSHLEHNETLTLNVSVKYWNNDTFITGLNSSNFKIHDQWASDSDNYRDKSSRITNVDTSLSSFGIYLINYTVPDITDEIIEQGEHLVKIKAIKNNYSTESLPSDYYLDGPDLEIIFNGLNDHNMEDDGNVEISFSISVRNNGNRTIDSVNLRQDNLSTTFGSLREFESCYSASEQIGPGETEELCNGIEIEFTSVGSFRLSAIAEGDYGSIEIKYSGKSGTYEIIENDDDTSTDTSESSSVDDTFNSGKSSGGVASTAKVEKKYLSITSFPEKVEIEQGKRETISVEIKNEDDWEFQDVTLEVDGVESSWITVIPSNAVEIEPLKAKEYRVTFEIPEDAEIKDYSGEFQVSSSFETKKQSFTLSVIPGPELQVTINSTIEDYQNQIQQLEDEIESMKNKGYNITDAEQKLKELKDEFNKLLAYRDGGNYKSAYGLLGNTGNLLNQTTSILSGAVVLPKVLFGVVESRWVLSGLFGVLFIVGGYTFWGRHYDIKKRILKKLKGKTKTNSNEKDLENIAKGIRGEELRTLEKIEKATEVKPKISERMNELELIKNLATNKKA